MGEKTKIIGMANLVFIKILLFTWLRKDIPGGIPGGMLPPGAIGIKPVCFFFFLARYLFQARRHFMIFI